MTHLVAPGDKLFVIGSGELRVQRHHLKDISSSNGTVSFGRSPIGATPSLSGSTYFYGTVKVFVEALSGVEAESLNLKQRRDGTAASAGE